MSYYRLRNTGLKFTAQGPMSTLFTEGGGGQVPVSNGKLWLNLGFAADWARDNPFIDILRQARAWRAQVGDTFNDPGVLATMMATADANGYPTVIPAGAACATIALTMQATAMAPALGGRYRLTWDGSGTVSVHGGASAQTNGPNQVEFNFTPSDENLLDIRINTTNPVNHVRNMKCYLVSHAGLLADGKVVHPAFKAVWGNVGLLRFMDQMDTNTTPNSNWSQAPTDTSIGRGPSIKQLCQMCNELGCDGWFNMPYASTSDYVTQAAIVVRDNLSTSLKAYVEYANEWWNFAGGFQTAPYLQALRDGKSYNWAQMAGGRSTETMIAWSAVFAGQMHRTVRVAGMHTAWHGLNDDFLDAPQWRAEVPGRVAPHTVHDANAITAYIQYPNEQWNTALAAPNNAARKAILWAGMDANIDYIIGTDYVYHRAMATSRGKKLIMYEGGTHLLNPGNTSNNALANQLVAEMNESPEMYARYVRIMDAWDDVGDGGFNAYVSVTRENPTATAFGVQRHLLDVSQGRYRACRDYNVGEIGQPPAPTVPAAFVSGDWTLTGGTGNVVLNIGTLPANGGSPLTALQYRVNSGVWSNLTGTGTGSRTLTLPPATYNVQIRAVNAVGAAAGSDTKSAVSAASGGGGTGTPVGGKTANVYAYYNSLHNHANPSSAQNANTRVGNWVKRMALQAPAGGNVYTIGAQFGFVEQWTSPPYGRDDHEEVPSSIISPWSASWLNASQITHVEFVCDNFNGLNYDPSTVMPNGVSYVGRITAFIDQWEANAPNPNRTYAVYLGWPQMQTWGGSGDNPGTIPPSGYAAWVAHGLGTYQTWGELLVSRVQAARPGVRVRLHAISKGSQIAFRDTVLGSINKNTLFEDMAPHGRGSMYFIAGVCDYIALFGEKPPVGFVFDPAWQVDAAIQANYQTIVDTIWNAIT